MESGEVWREIGKKKLNVWNGRRGVSTNAEGLTTLKIQRGIITKAEILIRESIHNQCLINRTSTVNRNIPCHKKKIMDIHSFISTEKIQVR